MTAGHLSVVFAVTVLAAVVVSKAPGALRRTAPPGRREFWTTGVWMWAAVTNDRLYDLWPAVTGLANLGFGLTFAFAGLAAHQLHVALSLARDGTAPGHWLRRRTLALLAVLIAGYVAGPMRQPHDYQLNHAVSDDPVCLTLFVVLGIWTAATLPLTIRLCWSLARVCVEPSLQWGMRLVAAGLVALCLRVVVEFGLSPMAQSDRLPDWVATGRDPVRELSTVAMYGVGLIALGAGLPLLHRCLLRLRRRIGLAGCHLDLLWLRRRLAPVASQLPARAGRRGLIALGSQVALYRVVIEIRDAFLELQPYRDADFEEQVARRLPDDGRRHEMRAVVDAAGLQQALGRRLEAVAEPGVGFIDRPMTPPTLDEEARYLRSVSRSWSRARSLADVA